MHILITGSNGQLGTEIKKLVTQYPDWQFSFADLPELDITNQEQLEGRIQSDKITAIINCAAYTAVDKAESDIETAEAVNATGPAILAQLAAKHQLLFIHISTDFVFDGKSCLPYTEDQPTNPICVYGSTKLKGEQLVLEYNPQAVIIRTSWLYSAHGNNFVKTMQRLGADREQLTVIFDQIGTPTWAADLAQTCLQVLADPETGKSKTGIYHFSNEGIASWYDFALEIMQQSGLQCRVLPIETKDYPTPAKRPAFSVMNKAKIKQTFGITIPHWKESLEKCIEELSSI
ncbi:dTDP-4-dehydrorhamnose reductase [Mangrovibacterium marinum]|uniref:dTDP-4-dehydrorhamnose reductase n=1 Tax=Mangrovibacterium marinum TaxID=1639118 RepID=A0A2T5BTY7_9BACT|nr:dTDP-4-dehydrorhamnose reductase [Mangrovibacterium marinum]PTN02871.1 dTDP-4-dehydrorhamnose reductase [Mangrovibacterium marinum]